MKIFVLLLVYSGISFCQNLSFFKEDITFTVDTAGFCVEGYYWFSNPSPQKIQRLLLYPFPQGGAVDSADVLNITKSLRQKIINKSAQGFYFSVNLNPGDTMLYRIFYRQEITSDSAVYILRSTVTWGKPLESAKYKLIIPKGIDIKSFSYPPDKKYNIGDKLIYYWNRRNFMPDKDMIFHIKKM